MQAAAPANAEVVPRQGSVGTGG